MTDLKFFKKNSVEFSPVIPEGSIWRIKQEFSTQVEIIAVPENEIQFTTTLDKKTFSENFYPVDILEITQEYCDKNRIDDQLPF